MAAVNPLTLYDATVSGAGTTYTTASTVYGNSGRGYETLQNSWKNFIATCVTDYTAGTSVDVTIEHSPSGATGSWLQVVAFTQVTTTDATEAKAVTSATIPNLLPFVRAKVVAVGSANYVVTCKLWYEDVKN